MKNVFPSATANSERHDELRLNLTRAEFYEFVCHAWNDVYWLAHLLIWAGFVSLLLSHHFDLRLQMVGARMRIACCSLIYRKVIICFLHSSQYSSLCNLSIRFVSFFILQNSEFAVISAIS